MKNVAKNISVRYTTDSLEPEKIVSDPNGSYTGRPLDPEEKPIQDADDL